MQQDATRSRSASPARAGIFAWPSSPRMHSRYTALADAGAAWWEQQRAMSPGRGAATDLCPGAPSCCR
jgi:hypothetical protein